MIKEPQTVYAAPEEVGPLWVIKEIDVGTAEVVAEFGYPTEDYAWTVFNALTKGTSDEMA